ncbi:MAG: hypothetical protein JSV62_10015 [Promethearchaeota archaeon]|nr:MAG: hypothetical protein JSV62_10015 [Candidatus Lokiarchaeota archaeon]
MKISIEDTRTGNRMKLDVKEHHVLERIIEIVVKHMGYIHSEQRSYALVYKKRELPNSISIKEAIHKFGLKEYDVLMLWSKVIGGYH